MSSTENKEEQQQPAPTTTNNQPDTYYNRKKNWISGLDNDTVLGLGVATATVIASIAAYPIVREVWNNITNKQQQLPPPPPVVEEEPYIEPTEPATVETKPEQLAPVQQQPAEEEKKEEEEDGVFYETELKRRQKLMGQKAKGSRYDSPFGRDIGGL